MTTPAKRDGRCAYVENGKTCRAPAVGEVQLHVMDRTPALMCERHIRPDMHPPDLHRKLVRW